MTVIDEIIKNKRISVNKAKEKKSISLIRKEAEDFSSTKNKYYRFQEELRNNEYTNLIAEYKPASPSQGNISKLKVEDVVSIYDKYPVDMISVLTEESYFKSNLENLKKAELLTEKALLRKDFVIDEYMIYEAATTNASCILLIEGICPDMEKYLNITMDLGLDAIVECHSKRDLENVVDYDPKIIGINNRNLSNFTINLDTTRELREYVPNYIISESGVKSVSDARLLRDYGADGVLIGTSILKNKDEEKIGDYIKELKNSLKK